MSLQSSRRRKLLAAYGHKLECRCCGATEDLSIDHVVPISRGGEKNNPNNWQILCTYCNTIKADTKKLSMKQLRRRIEKRKRSEENKKQHREMVQRIGYHQHKKIILQLRQAKKNGIPRRERKKLFHELINAQNAGLFFVCPTTDHYFVWAIVTVALIVGCAQIIVSLIKNR